MHKTGRPVLVGTTSVEKSEIISGMLQQEGIRHQVCDYCCLACFLCHVPLAGISCVIRLTIMKGHGRLRTGSKDACPHACLLACKSLVACCCGWFASAQPQPHNPASRVVHCVEANNPAPCHCQPPPTTSNQPLLQPTNRQVLNAKPENVERESEIVAQSGRKVRTQLFCYWLLAAAALFATAVCGVYFAAGLCSWLLSAPAASTTAEAGAELSGNA